MIRSFLLFILALTTICLQAITFQNLTNEAYISGSTKYTEKQLQGRVIFIECWGYRCPPCLASLPHIAKLASKYKSDNRVAIIGSHVWHRNDAEITKILKKNDCTYPVYQQLSVSNAPSFSGIPFAYILDHTGEVIWSGTPSANNINTIESVLKKAIADAPMLSNNSLVAGLNLTHCKDLAKRLNVGQNIESTLRQIEARIKRGGAVAAEAQELLDCCNEWAERTEAAIQEAIDTYPSKALAYAQVYTRTFPSRATTIKQQLAPLAKDPLVSKLAASRNTLEKMQQTTAKTANARKNLCSKAKLQLRQLISLAGDSATEDFQEVKALWEAYIESLSNE